MEEQKNEKWTYFEVRLVAEQALFADPLTRLGGERMSYPIPTYSALRGILEAAYWKPTFEYVIDDLRVMKKIEMSSRATRAVNFRKASPELYTDTFLVDVEYRVRCHIEWDKGRPDLAPDRDRKKHEAMATRFFQKGGRRAVYLGTRDCPAFLDLYPFAEGAGYYDNTSLSFGTMLHGITYPPGQGNGQTYSRLWHPVMRNGVIHFVRPEECKILHKSGCVTNRIFDLTRNLKPVEQEYADFEE